MLDHRCRDCRWVFNAISARRASAVVLIRRGFALGVPTAQLSRELGCDRMKRLELRSKPEPVPWRGSTPSR